MNHSFTRWTVMALAGSMTLGTPYAFAAAKTDGSVGAVQTLGGNFTIPQSLGRVSGKNLFHSFEYFNIAGGESARFMTTSPLDNVITRVTGGASSTINGLLTLDAGAGAPNLFFINPAGVIFGAGATVNVSGAFHASTANYVKFPEGNFYADVVHRSTFSSAPVEAFGFLGTTRSSILVNNGATVSNANGLSLIAGDIEIDNGQVHGTGVRLSSVGLDSVEIPVTGPMPTSHGAINILNNAKLSSAGDMVVSSGGLTIDGQGVNGGASIAIETQRTSALNITTSGALTLVNGGQISSGQSALASRAPSNITINTGSLSIEGNLSEAADLSTMFNPDTATGIHFFHPLAGSALTINSSGSVGMANGAVIDARSSFFVGESPAQVTLNVGGALNLSKSAIDVSAGGSTGGGLTLKASSMSLANGSFLWDTQSGPATGSAQGNIDIAIAGVLSFTGASSIIASNRSVAQSASVLIQAGTLAMTDTSAIVTSTYRQKSDGAKAGDVGVVVVGDVTLANGSYITSSTTGTGNAGNILVRAKNISVDGTDAHNNQSSIRAKAFDTSAGQTGTITLVATNGITISNGGEVSMQNDGNAIDPTTVNSTTLKLTAHDITLKDASITTKSTGNVAPSNINIDFAGKLNIDPSVISTSSIGTGNGGSIAIAGGNGEILLDNSQITTSAVSGNGGDISVQAKTLIMDTGFIQANTTRGATGGNVSVNTPFLISSFGSLFLGGPTPYAFQVGVPGFNVIQAASPTGLSGDIKIAAPSLDLAGALTTIATKTVDTGGLGRTRCQPSGASSLAMAGRGGFAPSARDLLGPLAADIASPGRPSTAQSVAYKPAADASQCPI